MDEKTRPIYMLPPRDTSQMKRCTQTENKEIKGYFIQMEKKNSWTFIQQNNIGNTYILQNRF